MTADELDTAALRERGPYITSMASDGYPVICVDTDSWNAMCDEIDRLRADLEIARDLVAHWQRLYLEADRERVELSAGRAAGGVQPAPAATWHTYRPMSVSTGADAPCFYCAQGQRHTNHYAQYPQPSAAGSTDGAATPEPTEFIYPGGGLAFTELRPAGSGGSAGHAAEATPVDWDVTPGRWALIHNGEVVATAGPGSQDLGPDWVPVEQVTRNWSHEPDARELGLCEPTQLTAEDYPEDHTGRDPHCGIVHPHSRTSRCAGD